MKKTAALVLSAFIFISSAFSQIRVGILNGPSCIPVSYLMENIVSIENQELTYEKFGEATKLLPKMLKDEIDIGFLPANVAAKVYNSSNGAVICGAISGYGNLALITKDKSISTFEDLKGKTVYVAGQGATPDYMMRYLLSQNNIKVDDAEGVSLDFTIPTAQIVPSLISGKIEYAVVPEPFVTIAQIKDSAVFSAIDLQFEFGKFNSDQNYPLTLLVINKKFAEEHSDLVKLFLEEYRKAYEYSVAYPQECGELCEKYDFGLSKNIISKAIPKTNYVYISADEGKSSIEKLLNIFLQQNPDSIGGKLPEEGFYFN